MNVAPYSMQCLELFSGVGMLGEGLRAGFDYMGIAYRTVCHVEREAHAASVLVARMEEGSMDAAPIWSDVTTFDARSWRGRVDCVVAGFPCQDLSVAGRRAGLDGARSGLFFEVIRIADDCGAWCLFLENVAGIASATASVVDSEEGELDERAAARVLGELADRGWNAEWLTLSASDVGASHGRERWFCVAWRDVVNAGLQHEQLQQWSDGSEYQAASDEFGDTSCDGRREGRPELPRRSGRSDSRGSGLPVADASSQRRQGSELGGTRNHHWGGQEAHGSTSQLCSLFAPGPADERRVEIIERNPELAPSLEPSFRRVVNGLAFDMGDSRAARLKCVGNGVVALCASVATVVLLRRAGIA